MTAATTASTATQQPLVFVSSPARQPLASVARALATRVADQLGAAAVLCDDGSARGVQAQLDAGRALARVPVVVALLDADSALELVCDSRHDRTTRALSQALGRAGGGDACRVVPVLVGVRTVAVPQEFAALQAVAPVLVGLDPARGSAFDPAGDPSRTPDLPFCRSISPDAPASGDETSSPGTDPRELDAAATLAVRTAVASVVATLERCPTVDAVRALPAPTVRRVVVELGVRAVRHAAAARALALVRALRAEVELPWPSGGAPQDLPGSTELTVLAALTRGDLDADRSPGADLRETIGRLGAGETAGLDRRPLLAGTLALLVRLTRESGVHADLVEGLPSSQQLYRRFAACRVTGPARPFHADRRQASALLGTLLGHVDAGLLAALTGASPWPSRR